MDRSRLGVECRIEGERLPFLEHNLAVAETLDTDLGPAEVEQHAHAFVGLVGGLPNQFEAAAAILDVAVGCVEADHVQTRPHHLGQQSKVIRRRSDGGDNLRSSQHKSSVLPVSANSRQYYSALLTFRLRKIELRLTSRRNALFQCGDSRQRLTLDELEEGPAPGRDV